MTDDLKPYPAYKDSGVQWLGQVPAHWQVLPSRMLFQEVEERDHGEEPLLSVTIGQGVIRQADLLSRSSKKDSSNEDKANYKFVQPGDIAYNKMRAWQGAIGLSQYQGIVSPAYVVVRPRGRRNPRYFHYLLRTPAFAKEAERWSYGITSDQWSLRPEHFKMIYCSVPSEAEQSAIVRFLDQADRRIIRYIVAKKRLIALLNEQKKAIIHGAVVRGLDPHVRLKPSGLDWLGEVPEHWDVTQLRRYWRVIDCKHLTVPFGNEGIPLASVREVQSFDLDLTTANKTTEEWYRLLVSGGRQPKPGDLIYCRNVSVGAAAYVNTTEVFAMGQDVCLIRSDDQNQRYLNYLLHSPFMEQQLTQLLIGSTFNRINVAEVKSLAVLVPPRTEQDSIAAHLDSALSEVDVPIERIDREIQLIREYRTRLTADVVTGKLDVREAAAKLPHEPQEPVALEEAEVLEGEGGEDEALEAVEAETGV